MPPFARLEPLITTERWSAVDDVAARLSLAVDLNLLLAGERLPPAKDLAVAFNVSEMTITRALRALDVSGVVVRQRGRNGGTFVAAKQNRRQRSAGNARVAYATIAKEVNGLLDHRRVLETGIAFAAAGNASSAALKRLDSMVHTMDEASSWAEMRAVDPLFHLEVADIGGSAGAVQALATVLARVMRYYQPPRPGENWRAFNDDHRDLVAAIAAGQAGEAARIVERHVRRVGGTLRES